MLQIIIVEDEPDTAALLENYLKQYSEAHKISIHSSNYGDAERFFTALKTGLSPDLILLDIELPGMNGMDAARQLRKTGNTTPVIFVTNLAQYAVKGYDVNALDFIVKPVSYQQFAMKLRKALRIIEQNIGTRIAITVDRNVKFIPSGKLLYVEILNHDLFYHTSESTFRCRGSLSRIEQELKDFGFLRISSCYLVNMKYIAELTSHSVILSNGEELSISRTQKKEILKSLTTYIGGNI